MISPSVIKNEGEAKRMQNKVSTPSVSDDMKLQTDPADRARNFITVMDECMPSPDGIHHSAVRE